MNGRDLLRMTAEAFETDTLAWAQAPKPWSGVPAGCHCALTGMQEVLGRNVRHHDDEPYREGRDLLAASLDPQRARTVGPDPSALGLIIINWNDAPERTKQEVIDRMRKAAA